MMRLRNTSVSAKTIVVSLMISMLSCPSFADSWTTYQGNAAHTSYVPATLNPNNFGLRWQKTIGTNNLNPVTQAAGKVYVSETGVSYANRNLYTLDAATGNMLWNTAFYSVRSLNPPSFAYGIVYIQAGTSLISGNPGSGSPYLYAHDATTGQQIFKTSFDAQSAKYYAPTIFDGAVYVGGGYYGGMYSFNAFTGDQLWTKGLPQYDQWTPAIDDNYAYTYLFGSYGPGGADLYVINRKSGQLVNKINDGGAGSPLWYDRPIVMLNGNNNAFVISNDRLLNFDLLSQSIKWQLSSGYSGQATYAKGIVYAIKSGELIAINEINGATLWTWSVPSNPLQGNLIVTDSHVFAQTSANVYAVDLTTHATVWSYPVSGSMSLSAGTLYVAGTAGKLTAITVGAEASADLSVELIDGPDPIIAGNTLTYQITAKNNGTSDASDVAVTTDALSAGMQNVQINSSQGSCVFKTDSVYCALGKLSSGESATIGVSAEPSAVGNVDSIAKIVGNEFDPNVSNNSVTVTTHVDSLTPIPTPTAVALTNSWTTYQGSAAHTGYIPIILNQNNFGLRWQKTIGSNDLNPVTQAAGKVFVTQRSYFDNGGLYTLDATTGNTLWSSTYGSIFSVNPPSFAYGNVYIQTGNHQSDTYLHAYDADSGVEIFKAPHSAQWERYLAPTIFDGAVYVNGGYYGGMYSFNAFTGEQFWFNGNLPQYDEWTPTVDANFAYTYLGDYSPSLYVINRESGQLVYKISDGGAGSSAPSVVLNGNSNAFVISNGRLLNFDLLSRSIKWQLSSGYSGQVAYAKGIVYAIKSGALIAINEINGATLWIWPVPGNSEPLINNLIVTDSHVFVQTVANVYAVDLTTHATVWSYPVSGSMSLDAGTLYVAGAAGKLTAITVGTATSADLSVELTDDPDPIIAGNTLTYQITAKNNGTSDAFDVAVTDVLPTGMQNVQINSSQGSCVFKTGSVFCALGKLSSGTSATITVSAKPSTFGSINNTAKIVGNEVDPAKSNNSVTVDTLVYSPTPTSTIPIYINAKAGTGGTINPSGDVIVAKGSDITFQITPVDSAKYEINGVKVDGVSQGAIASYTFSNVVTKHKILASFKVRSYNIAVTNEQPTLGKLNFEGVNTLKYGSYTTITAKPFNNTTKAEISVDGNVVTNGLLGQVATYKLFVDGAHAISVRFY